MSDFFGLNQESSELRSVDSNEEPTSQTVSSTVEETDEIIELGDGFNYDGYQVVRREFFAHLFEPSITFNNSKVYVNAACLNKFKDVSFVQILVNRDTNVLAIRPCEESERDSFLWCTENKGKRKPKQITCRIFFAMISDLMNWNPHYRYKLLGKIVHANGEYLIVFDLNATEVYQRTVIEGEKPKNSRTPVFPEGWKGEFGLPYKEHQKSLQINIFDGYAVYGINETNKETPKVHQESMPTSESESSVAMVPISPYPHGGDDQ